MKYIEVKGIKVYGYHGCMDEEAVIGTLFETDVLLGYDYLSSSKSDNLSETIDYVRIKAIVEEQVNIRAKLIETVIKRIVDQITSEFKLDSLRVKLTKHNPPIDGNVESVSVIWEE